MRYWVEARTIRNIISIFSDNHMEMENAVNQMNKLFRETQK